MLDWLTSCNLPFIVHTTSDVSNVRVQWLEVEDRKWIHLDGACMADWSATYSHLIRAFGLPDYFGRNLNALSECLTDTDVLIGSAFVVHFENPSLALREANSDALAGLLDTFADAAAELGQPVSAGQPWDRPAVPFHVLLGPDNHDPRLQFYPASPDSETEGETNRALSSGMPDSTESARPTGTPAVPGPVEPYTPPVPDDASPPDLG